MRTVCIARMMMKYSGLRGYVVNAFIEAPNHLLVSDRFKLFLKVNREVDSIHKTFIMDYAKALIGALRTFKVV